MPPTGRSRYCLEAFDTRSRLQLPMERLDPLLEIAALDQVRGGRSIGASDVVATTVRFPFVEEGGVARSVIPELDPGFVLRDDGRIFSRRNFPDDPNEAGHRYHFQAEVEIDEGGGRAALDTAASLVRTGAVEALYLGTRLRPQLDHSVRDACGPAFVSLPADPALDGRGVVVGIVELGCVVGHGHFRSADRSTRRSFKWVQ